MSIADYSGATRGVSVNLAAGTATTVLASTGYITSQASMLTGENGYDVTALITAGLTLTSSGAYNAYTAGAYTLQTNFDGIGAIQLNATTVRIFLNHEINAGTGDAYQVGNGSGGSYALTGARIDYLDLDRTTMAVVDGGLAYGVIHDRSGAIVTSAAGLETPAGLSNFCSSSAFQANAFGAGRGLVNAAYFTGQENGGTPFILDVASGELWAVAAFGQGGYENAAQLDTGDSQHVAFLLDSDRTGSPMYLYVGTKNSNGDFLDRNGLRTGQLFYWVTDSGETLPSQFTSGTRNGHWQSIAVRDQAKAGQAGYDSLGYKATATLSSEALGGGAFSFARPEDCTTNPFNGTQAAFASTGGMTGDVAGNIYRVNFSFANLNAPTASISILYDGDADPSMALRNPDNLDWADDGYLYVQEDRANVSLFGAGAVNPNEASIVRIDPTTGAVTRVAHMNRGAVPAGFVDGQSGSVGAWESSGILDVSTFFGQAPGTVFLSTVQAHGVTTGDLTSGSANRDGQLMVIRAPGTTFGPAVQIDTLAAAVDVVYGSAFDDTIVGDARANVLSGFAGNDSIFGGAGNDSIDGGAGNDRLSGDSGNDTIVAGAGTNTVSGGGGQDLVVYGVSAATIAQNGNGSWTISGTLSGASFVDTLTGVEFARFNGSLATISLREPTRADANGDGHSDLFWQNDDGTPAVWTMNGTTITGSGALANPGASWRITAQGDLNGDGRADLVWQNTNGMIAEWQFDGTNLSAGGLVINPGASWKVIGSGDFNADRRGDIVLQNTNGSVVVWDMNGSSITGGGSVANPGADWKVVGSGNFNGDGSSDLLLRHSDGSLAIWFITNNAISGGGLIVNPGASWKAAGTGDFNRDGKTDILLQHTDGSVVVWFMNGVSIAGGGSVANPGASWQALGTGDYNNDGFSDILLQNANGAVVEWFMSGSSIAGGGLIANVGSAWHPFAH